MAYRMTHKKSNGDVEMKRVDGDSVSTFTRKAEDTFGIVVKENTPKLVGYNFHPSMSKATREAEIRDDLNAHRSEYVHTKGMSKGGSMKHVARIPAELYWSAKAEHGADVFHDPKYLKRFCQENDLCVSKF